MTQQQHYEYILEGPGDGSVCKVATQVWRSEFNAQNSM